MLVNISNKIFKQFFASLNLYHLWFEKDKKIPKAKPSGFGAISIVLIKYSEFSKHL